MHSIALKLCDDVVAVTQWRQFYDALDLSPGKGAHLTRRFNIGTITTYDLFIDILMQWRSRYGTEATNEKLEVILRDVGFTTVADKIFGPVKCQTATEALEVGRIQELTPSTSIYAVD